MHHSNLPSVLPKRHAWNKGRIVGQKRPLMPKHVWAIRARLEISENTRDLSLFNMAIDSKLRGCDLVSMKVADFFTASQMKERACVLQSKRKNLSRFDAAPLIVFTASKETDYGTTTDGRIPPRCGAYCAVQRLTQEQVAVDLSVGMSTLNKWITPHRDTNVVSKEDLHLAKENDRLRRENWLLKKDSELLKKATGRGGRGISGHFLRWIAWRKEVIQNEESQEPLT